MSKWLGKRAQAISETINKSSKRTEYESDFTELMEQTDATRVAAQQLTKNVPNFLHPNPAARAKLSVGTTVSKLRKTAAERRYPHAVGELAEGMLKTSEDLPPTSAFGSALRHCGDSFQSLADAQHNFDAEVVQNLVEPMQNLLNTEFKEIAKHKKKLEGRRLDYDYKLRKRESGKTSVTDADIRVAEQKLEESKANLENAMVNVLENDVEQVGQLMAFVESYVRFTQAQLSTLQDLQSELQEVMGEASSRAPRQKRPVTMYDDDDFDEDSPANAVVAPSSADGPCAEALYDFEAENEGELSFREGDMITLVSRLDENWLEGELNGEQGIFPVNYVHVIRDV